MTFKICPICKHVFACMPEDVARCQCSRVSLTKAQHEILARTYSTCLCADCLEKAKNGLDA